MQIKSGRLHFVDEQEASDAADWLINELKDILGLNRYNIGFKFTTLDEDTVAQVSVTAHNASALIRFDMLQHGTEVSRFVDTVLHEMLHVVIHPFDLYVRATNGFLADHELSGRHAFEALESNVTERCVENMAYVLTFGMEGVGVNLQEWLLMELPGVHGFVRALSSEEQKAAGLGAGAPDLAEAADD